MNEWVADILLIILAAFCVVLSISCFRYGFKKMSRYNQLLGKSDWAESKGKRLSIGFGVFLLYLAFKLVIIAIKGFDAIQGF